MCASTKLWRVLPICTLLRKHRHPVHNNSVPTGERLHTLRRGRSPCAIHCLAFNHAATRLAASSDKGTVHVFQLSAGGGGERAMQIALLCPVLGAMS